MSDNRVCLEHSKLQYYLTTILDRMESVHKEQQDTNRMSASKQQELEVKLTAMATDITWLKENQARAESVARVKNYGVPAAISSLIYGVLYYISELWRK